MLARVTQETELTMSIGNLYSDIAKTVSLHSTAKVQQGCIAVEKLSCNIASYACNECVAENGDKCNGQCQNCCYHVSAFDAMLCKFPHDAQRSSYYVYLHTNSDVETGKCMCATAKYLQAQHRFAGFAVTYSEEACKPGSNDEAVSKQNACNDAESKKIKPKRKYTKPTKLYTRTCVRCGSTFDTTSAVQKYCYKMKIAVCSECNKVFQYRCTSKPVPCCCGSKECLESVQRKKLEKANKARLAKYSNKEAK